MNEAEKHIHAIKHWSDADRGPRGEDIRAAGKFIAKQQAEINQLRKDLSFMRERENLNWRAE